MKPKKDEGGSLLLVYGPPACYKSSPSLPIIHPWLLPHNSDMYGYLGKFGKLLNYYLPTYLQNLVRHSNTKNGYNEMKEGLVEMKLFQAPQASIPLCESVLLPFV